MSFLAFCGNADIILSTRPLVHDALKHSTYAGRQDPFDCKSGQTMS